MNGVKISIVVTTSAVFLMGCSSEESAIRDAVEKHISDPTGYCLLVGNWPLEVLSSPHIPPTLTKKRVQVLEELGFVDSHKNTSGFIPTIIVNLTPKGEAIYYPNVRNGKGGLCIGEIVFDRIVEYIDVTQFFGIPAINVSYTYHLKDIPSWADSREVYDAFPILEQARLDSIISDNIILIETSNGWRVNE